MSGETDAQVSGWTVDTLHSHVVRVMAELDLRYQQRFDAQQEALAAALLAAEKAVGTALTAAEKAVIKAETAADKRFEAVNEFRAQLADQAATFMPRLESDARFLAIEEKISGIAKMIERSEGRRAGDLQGSAEAQATSATQAAIQAQLADLARTAESQRATGAGRAAGITQAQALIASAIGVVLFVVTILATVMALKP